MTQAGHFLVSLVEVATFSFVILCGTELVSTSGASLTTLTSTTGSFTYPTYPSRYLAATEYTWLIKVEEDLHINLTLHVIDIEAYRGKCIDIIEIKDGNDSEAPLLGGYCNSRKPTYNILSSSNTLRVWFQSAKNSDGGLGFNVSYTTVPNKDCGGQRRSFPGAFSTPRYPLPYPNNRDCLWTIEAPQGMYIHVEFQGVFRLEPLCRYMECECADSLEIKDGKKDLPYPPRLGYCFAKPRPFTSRTNEVSVKFLSDYSGRFEGFKALYTTSLTKGCGADLWRDHGLITSPNYPHSYHSYTTCIWRITVPDGHYVTITFHEFNISASHHAGFLDNVEIRDGYAEYSPLLAKLYNAKFVSKVNSTDSRMYIAFHSGFNIMANGFKATYVSYKKGDVKKREPRNNDMELSGFSQKKAYNMATIMIPTWWKIACGLLGFFVHGF